VVPIPHAEIAAEMRRGRLGDVGYEMHGEKQLPVFRVVGSRRARGAGQDETREGGGEMTPEIILSLALGSLLGVALCGALYALLKTWLAW
jgi:hypothetical protein